MPTTAVFRAGCARTAAGAARRLAAKLATNVRRFTTRSPGGTVAPLSPARGRGQREGASRSDLPAVDPLDELGAGGLHGRLGRHDFDGVDGHEVVAVLVGGDALVEVAHLHVVRAP